LVPFSTFAKVTRGIATGANDYFTFKASKIDMYSIPDECLLPCVCHSVDVKDSVFTLNDFDCLVRANKAVFLFNGEAKSTDTHVKKYLHLGVNNKIDKRYLTASRSPWYAIEKRKPSPIWVSVFNRNGLRFIRNKANVYNLTTFHCIYNDGEIDTDILFAYLLTDVAKEIFLDNSRQYGNGLVKFEPNDLNKGMMFDLRMLRDDEKKIISTISEKLYLYRSANIQLINLLDTFFRDKYTSDSFSLDSYEEKLNRILATQELDNSRCQRVKRIKQLNFLDLFDEYGTSSIVENNIVCEESVVYCKTLSAKSTLLDQNKSKHLLVCLVKNDTVKQYENHTAKIYYTGKRFPATIELNKLFFFMPYRKEKGIRDLYYIRVARIGSKHEVHPDADPNDIRLVFEIEFVKQLFPDYKPIRLAIWETFTDTKLEKIMDL
jgi:adenine-specific DNA-methyltransferase